MKTISVAFANAKLKKHFEELREGKHEDHKLSGFIDRAIDDLKKDPRCGTKIHKKLWPNEYVKNYSITNLWKYDLPNAWRLIYIIETDEITIMSILLDWFDHKMYCRKFKY